MSDSEIAELSSPLGTLNTDTSATRSAFNNDDSGIMNSTKTGFSHMATRSGEGAHSPSQQDMDLVMDIPVSLSVELGRTKVPIKRLLQLAQGSVIELEAMAGDPMDVYVNGCLIALGEVVVTNEKFGIRLTDIVTPAERMQRVRKK
jgi:flagellar motor switch protein FliN